MSEYYDNFPLLESFIKVIKLPRYITILIIAVLLILFLVLVAFLEGSFSNGIDWSFWRLGLQSAIIVYIFVISPFIQKLSERMLTSLESLLPQTEKEEILKNIIQNNRRWEWVALLLGLVFFIALGQPWNWDMSWFDIYSLVTNIIVFALLGYLIYGGISGTLRLTRLTRKYIHFEIFDIGALVPVAQWSLCVSLAFVGGISLSVVFQPFENLRQMENIVVYSILVCVTILLFFTSMWSTHSAMASVKKRELNMVRENLDYHRKQLKQQSSDSTNNDKDRLYSAIAVWSIYEKQVREAPTWPFNAGILGRLVLSSLVPAIIYGIKIVLGLGIRL
ncbi:MAG: hypothetical protein JSU79_06985 [Dehalococcoidales bacterium]|nr:MAG: hypothetical protein JSU79_06985 [Dehalococcoidales bacterium]